MPVYTVIGWLTSLIGTILLPVSILLVGCKRKKKAETVKESGKDESWYDPPPVDCRDELQKAVDAAWEAFWAEKVRNQKPGDPPLKVNAYEQECWIYFKREEILADREKKKQESKDRRLLEKERKARIDEIKAGKTRDSDSDENTEGTCQGDFEELAVLIEPPECEKAANNLESNVEREKKEESRDTRKTGVLGSGPLGLTASGTATNKRTKSGKKEDSRMKRQLEYMEKRNKQIAEMKAAGTWDEKVGLYGKSRRDGGVGRAGESTGTATQKKIVLGSGPIGATGTGMGAVINRPPAKKE